MLGADLIDNSCNYMGNTDGKKQKNTWEQIDQCSRNWEEDCGRHAHKIHGWEIQIKCNETQGRASNALDFIKLSYFNSIFIMSNSSYMWLNKVLTQEELRSMSDDFLATRCSISISIYLLACGSELFNDTVLSHIISLPSSLSNTWSLTTYFPLFQILSSYEWWTKKPTTSNDEGCCANPAHVFFLTMSPYG